MHVLKKSGLRKPVIVYHLMYRKGLTNLDFVKALPYRTLKSLLKNLQLKKTDVIFKHKMLLDEKDSLNLAWNRIYEPFETKVVTSIVKTNDILLDIGANIGYYTLIFSKLTGKNGRVFAFEPAKHNFDLLNNNVNLNKYSDRVTTINKAVTDRHDEEITLFLNEDNSGMNRIFESKKYSWKKKIGDDQNHKFGFIL